MIWPREADPDDPEAATLVLRCEGPAAIEIQHLAPQILERVNRFFGFQAVGRLAIRQAPVTRRERRKLATPDPDAVKRIAASIPGIEDESLKDALARLGAAVSKK